MISPRAVLTTYGLAFGYVFMDVADKANKTYKAETKNANSDALKKTSKVATDCLLWQTFASVLVPGFTINRICKLSSILLNKTNVRPIVRANKVLTTAIGLCSIPLIIHPIDHACHVVMDKTVRPYLGIEPHLKE
jgi:fission process protein 1